MACPLKAQASACRPSSRDNAAQPTQPTVKPEKPTDESTKWTLPIPADLMALGEKDAKKAYTKKSISTWFVEAAVEKLWVAEVEVKS